MQTAGISIIGTLIWLAISVLTSYLFRPKRPDDNIQPGEVDIATCAQGTPYSVFPFVRTETTIP